MTTNKVIMTHTVIAAVERILLPEIDPELAAAIEQDLQDSTPEQIAANFDLAFPTWEAHRAHVGVLAGYYDHMRKQKRQVAK